MTQNEYQYLAYCDKMEMDDTVVLASNTMDGLMDRVDNWWMDNHVIIYLPLVAQLVDDTICIGDYQFLIYRRGI